MAWEHFDIFNAGTCLVQDMKSGETKVWEYDFGHVTTGKQRVFMKYRIVIKEIGNGRCFVGEYRHHLWGTLQDVQNKMREQELELHVAGTSERYYETGLSYNSGWGYIHGKNGAIRIMDSNYKENGEVLT